MKYCIGIKLNEDLNYRYIHFPYDHLEDNREFFLNAMDVIYEFYPEKLREKVYITNQYRDREVSTDLVRNGITVFKVLFEPKLQGFKALDLIDFQDLDTAFSVFVNYIQDLTDNPRVFKKRAKLEFDVHEFLELHSKELLNSINWYLKRFRFFTKDQLVLQLCIYKKNSWTLNNEGEQYRSRNLIHRVLITIDHTSKAESLLETMVFQLFAPSNN